jgi:fumarate reductase subunit C
MSGAFLSARGEAWLWLVQRLSAAVLAVAVAVHLATIVYAVRGGLSAADILARLHASAAWLAFYVVFVAAVAVHAPIGLRSVVRELTPWRGRWLDLAMLALAPALLALGLRAALGLVR